MSTSSASSSASSSSSIGPRLLTSTVTPTEEVLRRPLVRGDWRTSLLQRFFQRELPSRPITDSYDQYILTFKALVNSTTLALDSGEVITFSQTAVHVPTMLEVDQTLRPMFPKDCRRSTYRGRAVTTATWVSQATGERRSTEVFLGYIPVMTQSHLCNLRQLPREDLLSVGECSNDPGGYFIVDGTERVAVTQERSLPNTIICYRDPSDKEVVTELKATAPNGRKVRVAIRRMKHDDDDLSDSKRSKNERGVLLCSIPFFKAAEVNVFAVFAVLHPAFVDPMRAMEYIMSWLWGTEDDANRVQEFLAPSMENYLEYFTKDHHDEWSDEDLPAVYEYITNKLQWGNRGYTPEQLQVEINQRVTRELFVNMHGDFGTPSDEELGAEYDEEGELFNRNIGRKAEMLALLVARYAEVATGVRGRRLDPAATDGVRDLAVLVEAGLDNRDDVGKKYFDAAGSLLSFLTSSIWRRQLEDVRSALNQLSSQPDLLRELDTAMPHNVLTDGLARAIKLGDWNLPSSAIKAEHTAITHTLQRDSIIGTIADIRGINAPVSRKSHDPRPRSVHHTYWGFICPTGTREGEDCGLIKALGKTATFTVRRDATVVADFIRNSGFLLEDEDAMSRPPDDPRPVPLALLLDGGFRGWVDPGLIPAFRRNRRGGDGARQIPLDVSIFIDADGFLCVYTMEGRLTRPVLVVNEDRVPVIDAKGLRDADWETLLAEGALEYLDAGEQSNALIALNEQDLVTPALGPAPEDLATATYEQLRDPSITHLPAWTHLELHPDAINSYEASVAPFPTYGPGTRVTYGSNMAKHDVGIYNIAHAGYSTVDPATGNVTRHSGRFETAKVLGYPQRPLIVTDMYDVGRDPVVARKAETIQRISNTVASQSAGDAARLAAEIRARVEIATDTNLLGATGQNAVVAVLAANPGSFHEEDSMMVSKRFIDLGGFVTTSYKADSYEIDTPEHERLGIPPGLPVEKHAIFAAIDPATGVVRPGTVLRAGMAVIAKYIEDKGQIRNTSIYLKSTDYRAAPLPQPYEEGMEDPSLLRQLPRTDPAYAVHAAASSPATARTARSVLATSLSNVTIMDSVQITKSATGKPYIQWKLRTTRSPQTGDKFTSRFSQKGVIGRVVGPEDMPFNEDGITPDIIINPHAFPSRMTVNHLIETLTGKAAAFKGERVYGTAFHEVDYEVVEAVLAKHGYHTQGREQFTDGITGLPLAALVFQGPIFYQVLRHQVEDKKHARARGDVHHLYRQPPGGRSRNGGLRLGEMERDCLIAHGARGWLTERFYKVSDRSTVPVCQTCGKVCVSNPALNYHLCTHCGENGQPVLTGMPRSLLLLTQFNAGMMIENTLQVEPRASSSSSGSGSVARRQ